MRVTYTWTEPEWREAVALSTGNPHRRPVMPGLTWAIILLPLIGGTAEFLVNLRRSHRATLHGTILPLLLILIAIVVALLTLTAYLLRRRKRARIRATMPAGECEAVLQEAGWRFTHYAVPLDDLIVSDAEAEKLSEAYLAMQNATRQTLPVGATPIAIAASAETQDLTLVENPPAPADSAPAETVTADAEEPHIAITAPANAASLQPWSDLVEVRHGDHVIVLMHGTGFHAISTASLSPEQGGHLYRLVTRKLRRAGPQGKLRRRYDFEASQ